jgi:hypothetical protein
MNQRELEQLEKKSLFYREINDEMKDIVLQNYLNDLNKLVKNRVKKQSPN